MLSRIKNAARRFIAHSICLICDADHIDDLLRDCLAQATKSAVDEIEVDSDEIIEAIVENNYMRQSDLIDAIVEAHEVDTDSIAERIVDAIDLDDVAESVKDDIDGGEIRERVMESLHAEVKQEVVEGLIEDSNMQQEVAEAFVAAIKADESGDLLKRIAKVIADEMLARTNATTSKSEVA